MKNSEKGKFEDAWQKAFDNAEQAPSEDVWAGLEHGLNKVETITMRRRVVFYQRLAAASVLFALLLGGLSTYYVTNLADHQSIPSQSQSSATTNSKPSDKSMTSVDDVATVNDAMVKEADSKTESGQTDKAGSHLTHSNSFVSNILGDDQIADKSNHANEMIIEGQSFNVGNTLRHDYPSLLSMIPEPSVELTSELKEVVIVRKLPAMPSSFMAAKKDKQSSESLWASLGASTGNYSPSAGFSTGSSSRALYQSPSGLSNTQNAYSTASSKGTVFSVGMNLGKRLAGRWLLQGGVSYLNQAIGYTSNYAVVDVNNTVLASVADFSNKSYTSVVPVSTPYEINSVNEFISLPVQAGYLLVDKKFGLQLNSGISTDFFMQNTLSDKSGQLATSSSGAGESSPFRTISWAGLMGTELSYRIATQYRVSVAPGLRYSLNSVLKSDAAPSNPLVWDVGFRFRYIFR